MFNFPSFNAMSRNSHNKMAISSAISQPPVKTLVDNYQVSSRSIVICAHKLDKRG